jgi:glycosyltransferase involved in cell wall biosynthesis
MALRSVLIVTYHFPPSAASGSFRLLGFARHLPKFGWRAIVVAPPRLPWEPTDEALLGQVPPETALVHVPYPEGRLWKPLRKFAAHGVWLPFAWSGCRRAIHEHRPQAILTSGPPHLIHQLGRRLRHRVDLPWFADFRDPWIAGNWLDPATQVPRPRELRAEAAVMRDADAIVVNSPRACESLGAVYPEHAAKMVSITNGYDPENFEANSVPPLSGPVVEITHLGEIYANRDPGPFLEAIRGLGPDSTPRLQPLCIRFLGRLGDAGPRLRALIQAAGLESRVDLCGQIPYAESLRAMLRADLLLLLDSPGRRIGVPAKLYEYLGAGRPILALAESNSDVACVLQASGLAYRIAPPRDPEAIRRALLELLHDPATAAFGRAGEPGPTRFTREHLAGELAVLLDSCLETRSHRLSLPAINSRLGPKADQPDGRTSIPSTAGAESK